MEKLSIEDVQRKYNNKEYESKLDYKEYHPSTLTDNQIIDEDKSVKWNREEVIRLNERGRTLKKEYRNEDYRLASLLGEDLIQALINDYDINEVQAKYVYDYVYTEYHSCFNDVFSYLDDIMSLILKFNSSK